MRMELAFLSLVLLSIVALTIRVCWVLAPLLLGAGPDGIDLRPDPGPISPEAALLGRIGRYKQGNCQSVRDFRGVNLGPDVPVALSLDLTEDMQMAGWLYWRVYETRFKRSNFKKRFGEELDEVYGQYLRPLSVAGFL